MITLNAKLTYTRAYFHDFGTIPSVIRYVTISNAIVVCIINVLLVVADNLVLYSDESGMLLDSLNLMSHVGRMSLFSLPGSSNFVNSICSSQFTTIEPMTRHVYVGRVYYYYRTFRCAIYLHQYQLI